MPPVISVAPEVDSIADQLQRYSVVLAPFFFGQIGGKTSEVEFLMEQLKLGVGDVDLVNDRVSRRLYR